MRNMSKWRPHIKSLIGRTKKYAPFPTVAKWRDFGDISFNDHLMVFSRMDFLMSMGQAKWKKFLFTVKGRVDAEWKIDQTDLVDATRTGLKEAYNLTFLNFDDRWRAWVKKTYPSR